MNIGAAITELRKQEGYSQKDLAAKIGLSATSLSLIESGTKKPSAATIQKLCKALKISEPLLYIMATQEEDVPKKKRELFRLLFPSVKDMVLKIAGEE